MASNDRSSLRTFIYVLEPSGTSAISSLLAAALLVIGHIVFISLYTGTIWPSFLDGYFATYYTNYVVQPILQFFSLSVVGIIESVIFWSIGGGCLYAVLEYIFHTIKNWHQVETNVQLSDNRLIRHPQQRTMINHIVWRLVIGAGIALYVLFLAIPFIHYVFYLDYGVVATLSTRTVVNNIAIALGVWIMLIHLGVVLLRLYTFRLRLSGSTSAR